MEKEIKAKFLGFVLLVSILTVFSGLSNLSQFENINKIEENDSKNTIKHTNDHPIDIPFVYGAQYRLYSLDPQDAWDRGSFDVIQQVCEGLYGYNFSDPEMTIIPYLSTADGVWSLDGLNYTIPLRSGVTFHDGTPFNASAVKFTFDRLTYLLDNSMSVVDSLYHVYDPDINSLRRIINRTEIVDTYTIKFILNVPYGAFDALLCFSGSYILSPKSTPATTVIDTDTGDLVGTGPFVYDGYIPDSEVSFHASENYWQGKADIDQMKFQIITDTKQRQLALINKDVHFISSLDSDYFDAFSAIPYLTFLDTGKTSGTISYLGMNTKQINVVFREAISYAIDYDYLIDEIREGQVKRLKSPIPEGIRYANSSFDYPILNLTRARLAMQSLGYGIAFNLYNDAEWENAAVNGPFATFNYTYNIGHQIREDMLPLLQDNLARIGIKVVGYATTWSEFIYKLYEIPPYSRNYLQLYWVSWVPDFNDPSTFINRLFTNRTLADNHGQINDWIVQQWMEDALDEVDQAKREILYDKIQKRLVEEVYPLVCGTVEKLYYAHHVNLTGFQPNTLKMHYFYPCQWDPWYISPRTDATFKVGVSRGPYDLDPQNAWDQWSYQTIDQICEGLYGYNYSDSEMEIIPYLATAEGTWSLDGLNYTVPLRSGVTFHDGTLFNASAVKFTFDRLSYLINATGTNPGLNPLSVLSQLYKFKDGTPIIDQMEVIDTYTIRFILNAPYAPLQALLCFSGSYILSPTSTPPMDYIDTDTGVLVGTGPFVYDGYIPNVEINFHAYSNYWRGKAEIDLMKFKIYSNNNERLAALLTRDVDFIDDMLPEWVDLYKGLSNFTVLDEGKTNSLFYYLGMNNKQINVVFREAISYALDYDYIINEIYDGSASRMKSPVPDGLRYANSTFDYSILNLTHARLVIQSLGYGVGFDLYNDAQWVNQATNAPFATFNYTYNIGHQIREDILYLLQDNLAKIGIKVIGYETSWAEFIYKLFNIGGFHRNMLQLFWIGGLPDFNDPSNFLDLMFSTTFSSNFAQVDDLQVSQWLLNALNETNPVQREVIYDKIQKRLVEEVYPLAWVTVEKLYTAYHEDLSGFQQNALERLYFYNCNWKKKVPDQFILSSDAGTPDTNGNFNLTWSASDGAINYTVYQYSSYITSINGSLTPLAVETTGLTLPLNAYTNGVYYFIIVAHNEYGETLSNCISITISIPSPGVFVLSTTAGTPDIDGTFDLVWSSSSNADNYSVYQYDKYITVINGSLALLAEEITNLTIQLSAYTTGTYYFIVVAYNPYGETLSNCTSVVVSLPVPDDFILLSTADTPDNDGIFDLVWSSSSNADNYSIYQYDKYITVINGSLVLLAEEITALTFPLSGYNSGTYFFIIVAYNEYGDTISNCIITDVQIPIADSLTILIPDNTTSWDKGSDHYIYWTSVGDFPDVKIELYRNDALIIEIVPSAPNVGEYYWALPSTLTDSTQYQIRISDISDPSTYGFSDYFRIKSPASTIPEVPGYNIFLLIGITCIISLILLKKRSKNYQNL